MGFYGTCLSFLNVAQTYLMKSWAHARILFILIFFLILILNLAKVFSVKFGLWVGLKKLDFYNLIAKLLGSPWLIPPVQEEACISEHKWLA